MPDDSSRWQEPRWWSRRARPSWARCPSSAIAAGSCADDSAAATGEIEVLPVRGNVYALIGAGANIVASVGPTACCSSTPGRPR